jgi:hypothetical protein
MAAPKSLEEVIRRDCLPQRDCMLTITDLQGEAAFLYFKEGELIEANYAALWGKEALAQIVNWQLADQAIAPLPLGIKRSLWDPIEFLLHPSLTGSASGRQGSPSAAARSMAAASPFERFTVIEGLLKMVQFEKDKENVIYEDTAAGAGEEDTSWLKEFADRAKAVGDTLGFGTCNKWTVDTERYQAVGLTYDESFLVLLRRKDGFQEDLESAVNAIAD